jgi:peptide/nickel transport system permease protein
MVGAAILISLGLFALLVPLLSGIDPIAVHPERKLAPPGPDYLLGADQFGRDVAARLAAGIQLSALVAFTSVAIALVIGSAIGVVAGYVGGRSDEVLMRMTDVLLSFPYVVLAIALAAAIGSGVVNVILIIGVLRLPHFARIARGAVLTIKHLDYVLAARALGQSPAFIVLRHVLPNSLTPLMVMVAISAANAITAEAAMSFLGLGINPPAPSLGNMLSDAQQYVLAAPRLAVWPGLTISLIVLAVNLVGDSLQEALDPRLRSQ